MKINSKTPEILSLAVGGCKRENRFFYRFQLDISCFFFVLFFRIIIIFS